jgi:hypothetical protein
MDIPAIEAAVARSIEAETVVRSPSELYEGLRARFIAKRIAPQAREAFIHFSASMEPSSTGPTKLVVFLTDEDPQSVIYDPAEGSFGVAWGPTNDKVQYFVDCSTDESVLLAQLLCE